MARKKQVRLAINLLATGRHNASWKTLPKPEKLSTDIDTFIEIAKLAERGKLDGIFLADGHAGVGEESFRRPFRSLAPSVPLARLAAHTKNIGLVSTIPALYGNPATLAREIASLDQVSKGRAAWNIITSQGDEVLRIFGLDSALSQAAKYDKAEEFVSIVTQLWDSLPQDAIVADTTLMAIPRSSGAPSWSRGPRRGTSPRSRCCSTRSPGGTVSSSARPGRSPTIYSAGSTRTPATDSTSTSTATSTASSTSSTGWFPSSSGAAASARSSRAPPSAGTSESPRWFPAARRRSNPVDLGEIVRRQRPRRARDVRADLGGRRRPGDAHDGSTSTSGSR